jgi:hypothetical protein
MQVHHPLDDVHMSASERERAKAYMRQAELLADFVVRAFAAMQSLIALTERGARSLARRMKLVTAKPAQR